MSRVFAFSLLCLLGIHLTTRTNPQLLFHIEVANNVGVMEKSQQRGLPDLRIWDADVPRWFLQKFLHRDCLPSVNGLQDTTTNPSTELHQLSDSATTGLELLACGDYGWLYCWYGPPWILPHGGFKCGSRKCVLLLAYGNNR